MHVISIQNIFPTSNYLRKVPFMSLSFFISAFPFTVLKSYINSHDWSSWQVVYVADSISREAFFVQRHTLVKPIFYKWCQGNKSVTKVCYLSVAFRNWILQDRLFRIVKSTWHVKRNQYDYNLESNVSLERLSSLCQNKNLTS